MNPVAPYPTSNQPQSIKVPRTILYKSYKYSPEEGPWVMIPYAQLYGLEVAPVHARRRGDPMPGVVQSVLPRARPVRPLRMKTVSLQVPRRLGDPLPFKPSTNLIGLAPA